jgi:hypothetical protein
VVAEQANADRGTPATPVARERLITLAGSPRTALGSTSPFREQRRLVVDAA